MLLVEKDWEEELVAKGWFDGAVLLGVKSSEGSPEDDCY